MANLRTRYLGMELRSPLVASSSPLTGTLDGLRRLEAAGAGATGAEAGAGYPDQAGYGAGRPPTYRWSPRPRRPWRSRWWPA